MKITFGFGTCKKIVNVISSGDLMSLFMSDVFLSEQEMNVEMNDIRKNIPINIQIKI